MKNWIKTSLLCAASIALAAGLSACEEKSGPLDEDNEETLRDIVSVYTDNTVISTYTSLADAAMDFCKKCETLQENPTDENVKACCDAWVKARKYWELSEAFLYGPAEYNGLDPHIDSWPLDKDRMDQIFALNMTDIDASWLRANYNSNVLGFHAAEYVLFRESEARPIADIPQVERVYLAGVAGVLQEDCILLELSWKGSVSDEKQDILDAEELGSSTVFGNEMKNAGKAGSRFSSVESAVRQIIQGCIDIADEVGSSKLNDPYESKNVLQVESWYSWNSLDDFTDNIRSIENSYLGGVEGNRGTSLSSYVAETNADLDNRLKNAITNAKDKINAIPKPFRNNLDKDTEIQAAMEACNDLSKILEELLDNI